MWGSVPNRAIALDAAIKFTGDHEVYGLWMMRVVKRWRYSCEHNLSDKSQNRKAWIGHAACAYAMQIPEDIIRKAWSFLSDEQQVLANKEADKAIKYWESKQCPKEDLEQMSFLPLLSA
jgi:hypothetical protein